MTVGETVFLTGFPGFIAGRLVKRLAEEGARLLLLVQPALAGRAREELRGIARDSGASAESFQILEGDITQPNLGLSVSELDRVEQETTMLFHLAALYDLAIARPAAMRVNFEGTRNLNRAARAMRNLRRYHYVSTCYVAGLREGVIQERELRHHAGFRNYYEESKYLAELEVDALKSELPVTIHRPAVVCGDSRTGDTAKYDGIYYLIHYLRKWPSVLTKINIGSRNVRLNLVPVDFVIDAMIALQKDEGAVGATVQLADPAPLTTERLFDEIAKSLNRRGSVLTIPAGLVRPALLLPSSPKITGLPHAAVPYFFLSQSYDTTRAQELLEPHGVRCPAFPNYAGALVEFVVQHPRVGDSTGLAPA
jgi:nucleoside-diphosphate-sugar epimerase